MNVVRVKPGVSFAVIAPAGFRILAAIDHCSVVLKQDLTITSACDGEHSGPYDPHHKGEAFDVRSSDVSNKQQFLDTLLFQLNGEIGRSTPYFYAFLEDEGTPNEHFHIQRKKGIVYPPPVVPSNQMPLNLAT